MGLFYIRLKGSIGKVVSGIVSEMLKAAREPGVQWVTSIFNGVIREGKIPLQIRERAGW